MKYLFLFIIFTNFFLLSNSETTCELCEKVVYQITPIIRDMNNSIGILCNITKELCDLIAPIPIQKKQCNIIVDLIDEISKAILQGYSPYQICYNLGVCK